jgi:hypothetical protein
MARDPIEETVDYVAISRLQSAYADVVTRRAWPELATLFLADAPVHVDTVTNPVIELTGPQAVGDFIAGAIEKFEFFEFVVLNRVASIAPDGDPDRATGRMYICELRQELANGHWTQSYGVYHDDFRRVDGRWWFAERHYQSLARTGRAEVFPFPHHLDRSP